MRGLLCLTLERRLPAPHRHRVRPQCGVALAPRPPPGSTGEARGSRPTPSLLPTIGGLAHHPFSCYPPPEATHGFGGTKPL